ncbi:MAG: KH domain-containing protein [Verrucomicrobiota bacterium]
MEAVSGIQQFLEFVIGGIAERPSAASVTRREQNGSTIFDLAVDGGDIPRLIGTGGGTVNALRSLAQGAADRHGLRVGVTISE